MLEISALLLQNHKYPNPVVTQESCSTASLGYVIEHRDRNLEIKVRGDRPVDDCIHKSPTISLICLADIWNARELCSQGGCQQESSIAALLAGLYQAHGEGFVLLLQGSFAIILYDHVNDVLRAYVDPFGARSLAFTQSDSLIAVASDLRCFVKAGAASFRIDPGAILEYLLYSCIPAPRTIYQGIQRLEPGHQLVSKPTAHSVPYWDMSFSEDLTGARSELDWANATMAEIRKAVVKSIATQKAEAQVGCFLSGGTDSSSVTGLVGQLTGLPARSFSIGFDDPRYNETEYARIAARHHQTDHSEYFVTPRDVLELIPKSCQVYDEPFGNSSIIPTYFCARLARDKGITHLLAGDGGDELFGGNERYVLDQLFQRYEEIPGWMRRAVLEPLVYGAGGTLGKIPPFDRACRYVRRANIPLPDRFFSYGLVNSFPREELFHSDFLAHCNGQDPLQRARQHYRNSPTQSSLNRWLYLDLKMTIGDNDLRKVTRMSDLAGTTVRYPLLDRELAEFTGTIPASLKVKGNQLRYLFKKAMKPVLPPEILTKKKHGFGLPYSVWLGEHKPLKEYTFDVLGSARARQRGYFRKDLLEWLWKGYEGQDRKYFGDNIWVFVMLELWHCQQWDVG